MPGTGAEGIEVGQGNIYGHYIVLLDQNYNWGAKLVVLFLPLRSIKYAKVGISGGLYFVIDIM